MGVLKDTIDYCKCELGKIISIIILKIAISGLSIYQPLVYAEVINGMMNANSIKVFKAACILICVQISYLIVGFIIKYIDIRAAKNINYNVKCKVTEYIFGIPYHLNKLENGKMQSLMLADSNSIYTLLSTFVSTIFTVINVVGAGIVSILIDWRMTLLMLLPYPIVLIINHQFNEKLRHAVTDVLEQNDKFISLLRNVLAHVGDIQLQGGVNKISGKINYEAYKGCSLSIKQGEIQTNFNMLISITNYVGYIFLTCVGIGMVLTKKIAIGDFMVFSSYSKSLSNSIDKLLNFKNNIQPILVSANRVFELRDKYNECWKEEENKLVFNQNIETVQLKDIVLGYDENIILNNLNMTLKRGEIIGIIGENGVGKTTITKVISQAVNAKDGKVLFNNCRSDCFNYFSLIKHIAYVSNKKQVYYMSIKDNVFLDNMSGNYENICGDLGIDNDIKALNLTDTMQVTDFFEMSTGQMQKIQIARAFIKDCEVILLDEALSNLDERTKHVVKNKLKSIATEKIIVIISHVQEDYDICNKLYIVQNAGVKEIDNLPKK